jgi:hypothetical protein
MLNSDEVLPLKKRRRLLFKALQLAAKESPGGVSALAVSMGRNERVIADALNPDNLDKVPSLDVFLTLLPLLSNGVVVNTLLDGTGFTAMRREASAGDGDVVAHYMAMVQKTSAATSNGALALEDKHLTEAERVAWLELLHEQQSATADLIEVLRGA